MRPNEEQRISTVRDDIFERNTRVVEAIEQRYVDDPRGTAAFTAAFESYLRLLPNLDVAVDGFSILEVVEETSEFMRIVGLTYVLPSSQLPFDAEFRVINRAVRYRLRLGADDEMWSTLTESKQWRAAYLYATQNAVPKWNWDEPVEGELLVRG